MSGAEALPRRNGELVFEAPWEARAFGLAVSLVEEQGLDWEEFRSRLIGEIGEWERRHTSEVDPSWSYYEHWLTSLESLVVDTGFVTRAELDARSARIEEELRHEHDHEHEHGHEHSHRHDHDHHHDLKHDTRPAGGSA